MGLTDYIHAYCKAHWLGQDIKDDHVREREILREFVMDKQDLDAKLAASHASEADKVKYGRILPTYFALGSLVLLPVSVSLGAALFVGSETIRFLHCATYRSRTARANLVKDRCVAEDGLRRTIALAEKFEHRDPADDDESNWHILHTLVPGDEWKYGMRPDGTSVERRQDLQDAPPLPKH